MNHEEAPLEQGAGLLDSRQDRQALDSHPPADDRRRRRTDHVAARRDASTPSTGISEAPLQLKSNCGTLVIDDFGRQRMRIDELLNRWIVPLEKRCDFLNLPNGKKIQVPFDQLVVFSTNLEPRELVDEAFLRRIPYKIEVIDPTEDEFRRLFEMMGEKLGVAYRREAVDYLIATHFKAAGRPLRFCHPRDLLLQVLQLLQVPQLPGRNDRRAFRPGGGELLRGDVGRY